MTSAAAARDRVGAWCGWVLIGLAALTPLLAWLGPLGYAPIMGLAGLLCLPALRITDEDRPVAVVLLAALVWAAASAAWSPFIPGEAEESVALKLALQVPLYWAVWCGAQRAAPGLRGLALQVFAWGLAALGVLLLAEAFTGGAVYQALRDAFYEPIRPDLARKNIAQASFVLALLGPVAAAGGVRAGAPWWLGLPMAAGALALAFMFGSDAPLVAVPLGLAAGFAVWRWPDGAPKAIGSAAAAYVLLAPAIVLGVRSLARTFGWDVAPPESWAQRLGYWSHAMEWLGEKPIVGWGLDASRMFGPGIQLHPHNGALQLWLELGVAGAVCAALFWAFSLRRLSRGRSDLVLAGGAAAAVTYLLFGAVNFGVWQEWWLALGALAAAMVALADAQLSSPAAPRNRRSAAKSSTRAAFSG